MRKKKYKGRAEKRNIPKCSSVCVIYTPLQTAYALMLSEDKKVKTFNVNIPLDDDEVGEYMTDFYCERVDGSVFVRECVC